MTVVHIRGWPEIIEFHRGTILDAALTSGVPAPHQCCSGECGTCKCRLIKGLVNHGSHLPDALSDQEKADGWVLACRARPKTDVEIEFNKDLDEQLPVPQRRKAHVQLCERLNADVIRIVLSVEGSALPFVAGQFARLRFGNLPARDYSMANLPGARDLEFFVREMPDGLVSGHVARHLSVGDLVGIEGPFGNAYLRAAKKEAIIAVAGGSGLAPMLAIARSVAIAPNPQPLHFYFGVRREVDLFASQTLAQLSRRNPRMSVQIVLSEPAHGQDKFREGFPHEALAADFNALSQTQIYSAGPPPMVAAVSQAARMLGAQSDDIHSDPFTCQPRRKSGSIGSAITRSLGFLGLSGGS
ncbi:MAG: 2Fe-2S iron-sulfur cluster binding domain-containing protein [Alphaproteobacteria bacterium]|nr:2Fe-2S iron-sulfur cluster binding domain-containing protein [Alphaproteobacteria bacterium]